MNINHFIEISFSLGLFINAALFIPQCMRILSNKDSKEISLITFFGFWLILLSSVLHGFLRKDYVLMYGTMLSMITCGTVVYLTVYYRIKNRKNQIIEQSK